MQKLLFTSVTFLPYFEAIMNWNSKRETEKQKKTHKYQRLTLVSIRREVKPSSPQKCYGEERRRESSSLKKILVLVYHLQWSRDTLPSSLNAAGRESSKQMKPTIHSCLTPSKQIIKLSRQEKAINLHKRRLPENNNSRFADGKYLKQLY